MKLAHHWGINGVCARCLAIRNGNDSAICSGRKTARQAARDRDPLDGADAQALEGALAMTERELAAAEERNRELVRKLDQLSDCGQDGVCAISPGCVRHWAQRNHELVLKHADMQRLVLQASVLRASCEKCVHVGSSFRVHLRESDWDAIARKAGAK